MSDILVSLAYVFTESTWQVTAADQLVGRLTASGLANNKELTSLAKIELYVTLTRSVNSL